MTFHKSLMPLTTVLPNSLSRVNMMFALMREGLGYPKSNPARKKNCISRSLENAGSCRRSSSSLISATLMVVVENVIQIRNSRIVRDWWPPHAMFLRNGKTPHENGIIWYPSVSFFRLVKFPTSIGMHAGSVSINIESRRQRYNYAYFHGNRSCNI